jgi:hypothetical protein
LANFLPQKSAKVKVAKLFIDNNTFLLEIKLTVKNLFVHSALTKSDLSVAMAQTL